MNIKELKNIMKEVNEPNEYFLDAYDLLHPDYWIFKIENVRVKTLYTKLEKYRKPSARFDVFINGLFISNDDYIYENAGNTFFIKFIRKRFPEYDRFGNPYILEPLDEVKINGDLETYR
jgi:hypothetical protein